MASRLTTTLGAAALAVGLPGLPAGSQAAPVTDTEPNDILAEAPAVLPGDVITDHLRLPVEDLSDLFLYSGLQAGSFFDVFAEFLGGAPASDLVFQVFDGDGQSIVAAALGPPPPERTAHLTGVVPADGKLLVGFSGLMHAEVGVEDPNYRFTLTTTTGVPEPASLALLAAGVVGLCGVARGRKAEHP